MWSVLKVLKDMLLFKEIGKLSHIVNVGNRIKKLDANVVMLDDSNKVYNNESCYTFAAILLLIGVHYILQYFVDIYLFGFNGLDTAALVSSLLLAGIAGFILKQRVTRGAKMDVKNNKDFATNNIMLITIVMVAMAVEILGYITKTYDSATKMSVVIVCIATTVYMYVALLSAVGNLVGLADNLATKYEIPSTF